MNPKHEITKIILDTLELDSSSDRIKRLIPTFWVNPRQKETGGLRLTDRGFEALQKAEVKCYELKFDEPIQFTNELIIWMDQTIDCPYYVNHKKIWVFGEEMAVKLVLFSGNIAKYHRAQKRFQEKLKNP